MGFLVCVLGELRAEISMVGTGGISSPDIGASTGPGGILSSEIGGILRLWIRLC